MKPDSVFKRAFNNLLDRVAKSGSRATLESESQLADSLGVS